MEWRKAALDPDGPLDKRVEDLHGRMTVPIAQVSDSTRPLLPRRMDRDLDRSTLGAEEGA
jgi:hypothetical protein